MRQAFPPKLMLFVELLVHARESMSESRTKHLRPRAHMSNSRRLKGRCQSSTLKLLNQRLVGKVWAPMGLKELPSASDVSPLCGC